MGDKQLLFLVDERLKTFKNWPFSSEDKCSALNMAEAGFYSISTGSDDADAAKCFLCGKELDGWESTDDPWSEHKSHAPWCDFAKLGKREDDLLLPEFLLLVKQFTMNAIKEETERCVQMLDVYKSRVRQAILENDRKPC